MDKNYTDADLSVLTNRQREIFTAMLSGKNRRQIAEELNCTQSNVSAVLRGGYRRLDYAKNGRPPKVKTPRKPRKRTRDYSQYDAESEKLTHREKIILTLVQYGISTPEIAKIVGVTARYAANILDRAVYKLDHDASRYQIRRKKNHAIAKKERDYYNNKIDKFKEYNHDYYIKNRDKILARQGEWRKNKKSSTIN